jgi:hypothetical protein
VGPACQQDNVLEALSQSPPSHSPPPRRFNTLAVAKQPAPIELEHAAAMPGRVRGSLAVLGPNAHSLRPSTSRDTVRCAARGGGEGKGQRLECRQRTQYPPWAQEPRGRSRPLQPSRRRKEDDADPRVLVSGAMQVEVETVLQTHVHWYYHCLTSTCSFFFK